MPFTSLKLGKPNEYHHARDRYETRLAKKRYWTIAVVGVVSLTVFILLFPELFAKVIGKTIIVAIFALIWLGLKWLGAKFELFGEWLVNRTKR